MKIDHALACIKIPCKPAEADTERGLLQLMELHTDTRGGGGRSSGAAAPTPFGMKSASTMFSSMMSREGQVTFSSFITTVTQKLLMK
jgi:hypothetical protein